LNTIILIADFLVHFWLLPKKLTKTSTFSIPITIPTYQRQHTTYHISTYQHITYPHINISHTHISHTTYQHITFHIPHTTYQHTTIYFIPYYFYCLCVFLIFYCPNFCVCQYSIILPKNYTILKFKNILWNWHLQINDILVNSAFGKVSTSW
jgi:hypothetical protein